MSTPTYTPDQLREARGVILRALRDATDQIVMTECWSMELAIAAILQASACNLAIAGASARDLVHGTETTPEDMEIEAKALFQRTCRVANVRIRKME